MSAHPVTDAFRRDGCAVIEDVLDGAAVERLRVAIIAIPEGEAVRKRRGVYGVRNLLEISDDVRRLAGSAVLRRFVTPILGDAAFAARAIFFDKVPGANWSLGWHQDSVISVTARCAVPGFDAWSRKAGVWQVQPPAEVLGAMMAVRVHLDDCPVDNGALRVIPGSHVHGWLDDEIDDWKARGLVTTCPVRCGGVVLMRPLLLHASPPSRRAGHRRVIHIEYACEELPGELDWNNRVGVGHGGRRRCQ
ncbi:MAG: phytanoyl-CoA dioxygenase [Phycisphaeraceae bacterium]|nr:phytanoyl-CoA dioxygenase [Phycisphaeraceae bacterium]